MRDVPEDKMSFYVFRLPLDKSVALCSLLARIIPGDAVYLVEEDDESMDNGEYEEFVKVNCWLTKKEMAFVEKLLPCRKALEPNWDAEYSKLLDDAESTNHRKDSE